MKKKLVMTLLVTTLVIGTFTGCGNKMAGDGKVQAAAMENGNVQDDGSLESVSEETTVTESEPDATAEPEGSSASEVGTVDADLKDTAAVEVEVGTGAVEGFTFTKMDSATMYAKSSVNVRDMPSTDGAKVGRLTAGQEVVVTGECAETGWYRIMLDGAEVYVSNSYITADKPSTSTAGQSSGTTQQTATQTTQGAGTTTQTQQGTGTTSNEASTAFIDYLNQQRAAAGLSQVTWDSGLASAAKTRAVEISTYFEHDNANRVENILGSDSSSVSAWYTQWYNSDIHRIAMMDPNLTSAAAAFYEVDGYYWVVFLAYREVPVMSQEDWDAAKTGGEYNQLESVEDGDDWNLWGTEGVEVVDEDSDEYDTVAGFDWSVFE